MAFLFATGGCDFFRSSSDDSPDPGPTRSALVSVDWLGRGVPYAAQIHDRQHGLIGVIYADGEQEWVEPARVRPLPDLAGQDVQIFLRSGLATVRVLERRGDLFHVRFADDADTWVNGDVLYALRVQNRGQTNAPAAASGAVRAAASTEGLRSGQYILAYWQTANGPQLALPYLAEVASRIDSRFSVRWLSDGSQGEVPHDHVLRVFEPPPSSVEVGRRIWLRGPLCIGTVSALRAGFVQVRQGNDSRWVEISDVIAFADAIDADRVTEGAHVTAVWNATRAYHATVQAKSGDRVTLAWHDGSSPSVVPVGDVIEVWSARSRSQSPTTSP